MKTTMSLLLMGVIALFAATSMSKTSMTVADAAATTGGIHGRIVKENRYVLFNSRQLTGECMQICTMEGEEPIPVSFDCPEPQKAYVECVHDVDCIKPVDGIPKIYGSCPKCVKESDEPNAKSYCIEPEDIKGNLNCCKRTPGNDLVITNGCGANNICVGFRDHDQCNVNQHAVHCNPCCPGGNVVFDVEGGPVFKANGDVMINDDCHTAPQGMKPNCTNDQGNPHEFVAIYPLDFCMTENIKWKERPGNSRPEMNLTGTFELLAPLVKQAADSGTPLSDVLAPTSAVSPDVGGACVEPQAAHEPECTTADDCWRDHPDWFCPKCVEGGYCVDVADPDNDNVLAEIVPSVNANVNCCKRTPGTEGIITNGCGANNICVGFTREDQCEVNEKAAYCHMDCPRGNVYCKKTEAAGGGEGICPKAEDDDPDFQKDPSGTKYIFVLEDGKVKFDGTYNGEIDPETGEPTSTQCNLDNRNGKLNDGIQKPMPRIYPMDWCKCRNVYWKEQQNDPDVVVGWCNYTSTDVHTVFPTDYVEPVEVVASPACYCPDYSGDKQGCQSCSDCTWSNSKKTCT